MARALAVDADALVGATVRPTVTRVTTLGDLLLARALDRPDADALVFPDERLTFRRLAEGALAWARLFVARGVEAGDHVGLLLPNGPEFMEVMFGVMLAGAVAVPINTRYREREIAYLAENADLVAVVTVRHVGAELAPLDRLVEALPEIADEALPRRAPRLTEVIVLDADEDGPGRVVAAAAALRAAAEIPDADLLERRRGVRLRDPCLILYTSGTTSDPKGCLLSHEAVFRQGQAMAQRYWLTAEDRLWCALPMFHVGGISPVVAAFTVGGPFLSMRRFEAGEALAMHEAEGVTVSYILFAAFITDMLYHPACAGTDLSRIRLMVSCLAVQSERLRDELTARLPHTVQIGTFGMTETIGCALTHAPDSDPVDRVTRLGYALPGVEARIVRADGSEATPGEDGEIWLRGPTLFSGYYKDAAKTAQALDGGWYHTGDRGSLSAAGSILFAGRIKDMLKVGGENVAAQELEIFIGQHPAVKLCCVVGIPDPRLDEVPAAFIELKPGHAATEEEIVAFCRGRIASFKVPRYVRFVEEWPMSASKIQKFKLRETITGA